MEYKGKQIWSESPESADEYRRNYVEGINHYILRQNEVCKRMRSSFMTPEKLVENPDYFRTIYRDMLGIDTYLKEQVPAAEIVYVGKDEICDIYRLQTFITAEIPFYAMLLIPHGIAKCPLVIAQHGGGGTPELCSDMCGKNNYNHMVQRVLERGAAVLAPQLLLWATEEIETMRAHKIPFDRNRSDRNLKRFGGSITGLEIAGIIRYIDLMNDQTIKADPHYRVLERIDGEHLAMIGLSYGGYFTLHTMAADTRIKAGFTSGCFNDRDVYEWSDWVYRDSALHFQDAEVAALCAPRKLYIQVGKVDEVFDWQSALLESERIRQYYEAHQCLENVQFSVWDGGHTVSPDEDGYDFLFSVL